MKETNRLHQQSENSRAKLLAAARELFFSHGFAEVSVNDICARAGMTKGAFYYHFDSKEDLFRLLFTPNLDIYLEKHYDLPPEAGARERFLLLARCTFRCSQALGRELMAQDLIRLLSSRASNLYDESRIHTRLLDEAFRRGKEDGTLRPELDRDGTIMLYACIMNGFLVKWSSAPAEDDARVDWDRLLTEAFSLMTDE